MSILGVPLFRIAFRSYADPKRQIRRWFRFEL